MQFEQFRHEVLAWQRVTFPNSTAATVLSHLKEEAEELGDTPGAEEAADVLMLLIALADKMGFDLLAAAQDKLEINKHREWTTTAAEGHTKHTAVL